MDVDGQRPTTLRLLKYLKVLSMLLQIQQGLYICSRWIHLLKLSVFIGPKIMSTNISVLMLIARISI